MPKISERYENLSQFEALLDDAEKSVGNDWEEQFVKDVKDRFSKWKGNMNWSDRQNQIMKRIAYGEEEMEDTMDTLDKMTSNDRGQARGIPDDEPPF